MNRLQEHAQTKKTLLEWYDRVIEHGQLLGLDEDDKSVGSATLKEQKEALAAERFIVAVCGQMNAGKSTLLNALLFEDEILPASPTTMTAKIALLEGGKVPGVEATLYSQEEFDLVVAASTKDAVANDEFTRAREATVQAGLQERDLLTRPPRIERRNDLKQLREFVAIPDDGGLYTPYVSCVRVRADIPWLYEVTVADTPGTNDPNPERDKITREWIKRADAVVYVTYAGQAGMNADDIRFIDEYLIHVSDRRRIIAVNKCDALSDSNAVWSYLDNLRSRGSVRMQELLGDRDGIVLVSGLGGLIECMESAGRTLSENLTEWRSMLNERGFLDPEKHSIHALRSLIEERIIRARGESVIKSHRSKLAAVFDRISNRLNNELNQWQGEIATHQASSEKLAQQRQTVDKAISDVGHAIVDRRNQIKRKFESLMIESDKKLDRLVEQFTSTLEASLKNLNHIDNIVGHAKWKFRRIVTGAHPLIATVLFEDIKEVDSELSDAEIGLNEVLLKAGLDALQIRPQMLDVDWKQIIGDIKAEADDLDELELNKLVVESVDFIDRFFNTTDGRDQTIQKLMPKLGSMIDENIYNIKERKRFLIEHAIDISLKSMDTGIQEPLHRRRQLLANIELGVKSSESEVERITEACAAHETRLAEVNALHAQFKEATS